MAAGMGTRFGRYMELVPKGFVEVGGEAMIVRSVRTLLDCGIRRIILGTGYRKEAYEALHVDVSADRMLLQSPLCGNEQHVHAV